MVADGTCNNIIDPTPDKLFMKRKAKSQGACEETTSQQSDPIDDLVPPESGWSRYLPSDLEFNDLQIREHALNSGKKANAKSQTRKKTCIRPETKGYKFFVEKFLYDIWCATEENKVSFKSRCFPSQKKNDTPHKLWSILDRTKDFSVLRAQCSCAAGLSGYCNHVMALLYQISHFCKSVTKRIPEDLSKTSMPQVWHKPRIEGISPEPLMECILGHKANSKKAGNIPCSLYEARASHSIENDARRIASVKRDVAAQNPLLGFAYMASVEDGSTEYSRTRFGCFVPKGSVLSYQLALTEGNFLVECNPWAFEKFRCEQSCVMHGAKYPPLPFGAVPMPDLSRLPPNTKEATQGVFIGMDEAIKLEECTRGQSSCPEWWKERQNRLTASNFSEICKRRKTNCEKFVQRLQKEPGQQKLPQSLKHGRDHEATAIRKYLRYMWNIGHKVELEDSGLVVHPSFPYIGCTPDAKVMDPVSHPHFGILEVKCPYKFKGVTVREAVAMDEDFYLKDDLQMHSFSLKKDHAYYIQVQGQMGVTGAEWCDFVVYTFKGPLCPADCKRRSLLG